MNTYLHSFCTICTTSVLYILKIKEKKVKIKFFKNYEKKKKYHQPDG